MTYDDAHHWRMMEIHARNQLHDAEATIRQLNQTVRSWKIACDERDDVISSQKGTISQLRNEVASLKRTIDSLLSDLATSESRREKATNLGNQLTEDLANHMQQLDAEKAARESSERTLITQIAALASAGRDLSPEARREFINLYQAAYRSEAEANQLSTESFNLLLTEDDVDAEADTALNLGT